MLFKNASFLSCLLFVSHETFQAIIQSIHKGGVMNWGLGSGKFAGEALVSVRHNVFILVGLPAVENVINIQVESVVGFFNQLFYEISLECDFFGTVLQRCISAN